MKAINMGSLVTKKDIQKLYGDEYADNWEMTLIKLEVKMDLQRKGYDVFSDTGSNKVTVIKSNEKPVIIEIFNPKYMDLVEIKKPVTKLATVIKGEVKYFGEGEK